MLFSFCFQGNVQADVNTVQSGKNQIRKCNGMGSWKCSESVS